MPTHILAANLMPNAHLGVLFILALLFALYAQYRVTSAYNKNARIPSRGRITGYEAAEAVMARAGIHDVKITETAGHLTDHYDPTRKRLVLSTENYRGTSLAALGVAAHEAGHAIQHKKGYPMLKFRMALVPVTQITSKILPIVVFSIMFMGTTFLQTRGVMILNIGIICFSVLTLFHLVTLPVEYDASRRAKRELAALGIIAPGEEKGVNETLDAAALTYVAAFLTSLVTLLSLLSRRR